MVPSLGQVVPKALHLCALHSAQTLFDGFTCLQAHILRDSQNFNSGWFALLPFGGKFSEDVTLLNLVVD